jgi:DNA integrity scanning protein DisA with diadenylate cyclase activity
MRLGLRRFAFQTVNKVGIFRVEQVQFFWLLIQESVVLLDKHPSNSVGIYLSKISNLLFRSGHDLEEKFMEQSLVSLKNYLNSLKIEGKSRAQIEADSLVTASSAGQIIENISSVYNIVEQINRNIILNSHSSNVLARKLTVDKHELQLDVFRQELDEMIRCLEMAL